MGKSTLFNRLIRRRTAITDDRPGITRDRIYAEIEWSGRSFTLVDTGGYLPETRDVIEAAIREQVEVALRESDLILLLSRCRDRGHRFGSKGGTNGASSGGRSAGAGQQGGQFVTGTGGRRIFDAGARRGTSGVGRDGATNGGSSRPGSGTHRGARRPRRRRGRPGADRGYRPA